MTAARWMVYDPEEGWREFDNPINAEAHLDWLMDTFRDQSTDGWHEDVASIAMYRLVPVVTTELVTTATDEHDSEEGQRCRDSGWDYIAELRRVEHADEREALIAERDALAAQVALILARAEDAEEERDELTAGRAAP